MKGWKCEEWMDWAETYVPFCTWNLVWPPHMQHVKDAFESMWSNLRAIVLHYMRPDINRAGTDATERARKWGQKYASLVEKVWLQD